MEHRAEHKVLEDRVEDRVMEDRAVEDQVVDDKAEDRVEARGKVRARPCRGPTAAGPTNL